jgi:hypothetical protein
MRHFLPVSKRLDTLIAPAVIFGMDWAVLESYESEVEARVVESFLRAQGYEVELLDTFGRRMVAAVGKSGGLRLMVRARDVEAVRAVLIESQRGTHLSVAGEETPVLKSPLEKWLVVGLLLLAALVFILTRM